MKTTHEHRFGDCCRRMEDIPDESVHLVVTSPPYPMIDMWDPIFSSQSREAASCLKRLDGPGAFAAMHAILDTVWLQLSRVLKPGGFACINIGDATRTIGDKFSLFPNHARIIQAATDMGFSVLPCILWRKPTNAPNKFMGSGMLPAGAYVTLEHEYILILRKGNRRVFRTAEEKQIRRESAIFWEERNQWFSDVWFDLTGSRQKLDDSAARKRSGAFPFILAYRLINMYSVRGDLVLDPFSGTGTTMAAAMAAGRNSLAYEIDPSLEMIISRIPDRIIDLACRLNQERLAAHQAFIRDRIETKEPPGHTNTYYGFPVITRQERDLILKDPVSAARTTDHTVEIEYTAAPLPECAGSRPEPVAAGLSPKKIPRPTQGTLF